MTAQISYSSFVGDPAQAGEWPPAAGLSRSPSRTGRLAAPIPGGIHGPGGIWARVKRALAYAAGAMLSGAAALVRSN